MDTGRRWGIAPTFPPGCCGWSVVFFQRPLNAPACLLLAAVETVGVDAEQHVDAVTGPFSDALRFDASLEPGRDAGVPQVVGPFGQRPAPRSSEILCERR